MKTPKITRRKLLHIAFYSAPAACVVDTFLIEPVWLKITRLTLTDRPSARLVHFSDLHYKGTRPFLEKIVRKINELSPDLVCFTGDIVERQRYLDEALEILATVRSPMFGVPGNWEYLSEAPFSEVAACFESTGGAWLVDTSVDSPSGEIRLIGSAQRKPPLDLETGGRKSVLLVHYPALVDKLAGQSYDLILAGHSHGGQCRIPFWGAVILPNRVGKYEKGLYRTSSGPLYVNAGIGTFYLPVRFFCRPEITVVEI